MGARSPAPGIGCAGCESVSAAYERAFRKWSDSTAEDGVPGGVLEASPSFRVYTPAEMRMVTLRPSHRPSTNRRLREELRESIADATAAGPRVMLKWMAIGIAVTSLLIVAFISVLSLTDDMRVPGKSARGHAELSSVPVPKAKPVVVPAAPIVKPVVQKPANDFELPAEPAARRTAKKSGKGAKPKAFMRDAPF